MAKFETITTPAGRLSYPYLTGKGRDYKGNGNFAYSAKFILPPGADADALEARLAEIEAAALASPEFKEKGKKALTFEISKRLPDNSLQINLKANLTIKSKKTQKVYSNQPRFFDSKGNPVANPEALKLGSGTRARVTFSHYAWVNNAGLCGVKLEPKALQILEAVQFTGGGSADAYGFEEEDGGFVFEPADEAGQEPVASTTGEL